MRKDSFTKERWRFKKAVDWELIELLYKILFEPYSPFSKRYTLNVYDTGVSTQQSKERIYEETDVKVL